MTLPRSSHGGPAISLGPRRARSFMGSTTSGMRRPGWRSCKELARSARPVGVRLRELIATLHGGRVPRWSFAPSMGSATPRSLLDALDGQREDRLHRRSAAINV